jgi:hypothetical protein
VVGPVRAHLERVQRQALVVDGAGRAGQVVDDVYRLIEKEGLGEIVMNEVEVRTVLQVLDVLERPRVEVVDTDNAIPFAEKEVAQVRAEQPGSATYNRSAHAAKPPTRFPEEERHRD